METDTNVERARKRRDEWPEWKREFQLFEPSQKEAERVAMPRVLEDTERDSDSFLP